MRNWQEEYEDKLTTPEKAMEVVKSGDRVAFTMGNEALTLGLALMARIGEVTGVRIYVPSPARDFAWYDPGWEEFFMIEVGYILPTVRQMIVERRGDYLVSGLLWAHNPSDRDPLDVILAEISSPDEHGYCSFGASLWNKKTAVKKARIKLGEVNDNLIRTHGDNFIHISEFDYFVKHTPTGRPPGATDMLGRKVAGPGNVERQVAEYVSSLIGDGDTLEIGVGGTAEWIAQMGVLDNRLDLGWHSENTPRGIATLVQNGVITGKYKSINTGKMVATAVGGGTKEEMNFIHTNPLFEVYDSDYVLDPRVIASNDNVVAINSATSIDLTGQIAAESVGPVMVSGSGGQLAFAIGSSLSRGGRNITVLTSTLKEGKVSRIVPTLDAGTVVTVPRTLADFVITEYGIARLKGKTQRERAQQLVAIAHPDFRKELEKEANKLYWP